MEVFENNLYLIEHIFSNKIDKEKIEHLKDIFYTTEKDWEYQTINKGLKKVKYLLICESPPFSENKPYNYFYSNPNSIFHTRIWKSIFPNEKKPLDKDLIFQKLVDKGFLLIDSIPYAMKFQPKNRKTKAYSELVKNSINWWTNKLTDNFEFNNDTKIAFAFKLNAFSVLEQLKNELNLKNNKIILNKFNIGTDGSGMPNSLKISDIFDIDLAPDVKSKNSMDIFLNSFVDESEKYKVRRLKEMYSKLSENEKIEIKKSLHYYKYLFDNFDNL